VRHLIFTVENVVSMSDDTFKESLAYKKLEELISRHIQKRLLLGQSVDESVQEILNHFQQGPLSYGP